MAGKSRGVISKALTEKLQLGAQDFLGGKKLLASNRKKNWFNKFIMGFELKMSRIFWGAKNSLLLTEKKIYSSLNKIKHQQIDFSRIFRTKSIENLDNHDLLILAFAIEIIQGIQKNHKITEQNLVMKKEKITQNKNHQTKSLTISFFLLVFIFNCS